MRTSDSLYGIKQTAVHHIVHHIGHAKRPTLTNHFPIICRNKRLHIFHRLISYKLYRATLDVQMHGRKRIFLQETQCSANGLHTTIRTRGGNIIMQQHADTRNGTHKGCIRMITWQRRRQRYEIIQSISIWQQLAHWTYSMRWIWISRLPATMGTHPTLRHRMSICALKVLDTPKHPLAHHFPCAQMPRVVTAVLQHYTMPTGFLGHGDQSLAIRHRHGRRDLQSHILAGTHCSHRHAHVPFPRGANPYQIHVGVRGSIAPVHLHIALNQNIGIWNENKTLQCSLSTLPKTYERNIDHTKLRIHRHKGLILKAHTHAFSRPHLPTNQSPCRSSP